MNNCLSGTMSLGANLLSIFVPSYFLTVTKYKYIKEIHFCVIFLAKKFVLSMIIRIFAALVPAEPLYNA